MPSSQELSTLDPTLQQRKLNDSTFQDVEPSTSSPSIADYEFPEGGLQAWLVVSGSFCIISGTYGLLSSIGIFQAYWQENQLKQYTSRDVGWIAAVNAFLNLFLGVQVGPLFDAFGSRWLLLSGSVLYVASLFLLAECKTYYQFMLVYGIMSGVAGAMLTTTALAVVSHWFEVRRGLASGVAFVGSSVGGIIFPLLLRYTLEHMGWAWSMRIVGFIVLAQMILGNLAIRGRLPPKKNGGAVDLKCFQDARFSWATMGIALFEFVLFGALGLLPTFSVNQGFSNQTSFNIIAILNAGSAVGRAFSGYLSDRFGRFNTMILTLTFSMVVTFALWLPVGNRVALFYVFAPLFGFGTGSIICMAPVVLGELCTVDKYGQYYGTSYSAVAFAVLICIPLGGEVLPRFGAEGFVAFLGGVLVLSLICFLVARWACLEYKWKWLAIV